MLFISADRRADVQRALTAGEQAGIDDQTVKDRIKQALAIAVTEIVQSGESPDLFLTGGEIATVVLSHLDTAGLRMLGEQVARGIPLASAIGGTADRSVVVTKAGGFGAESAMIKSLTRLGYHHE